MDSTIAGLKIYKVGGAVRDQLLGYPSDETDWVVVGATATDMLSRGFRQVGKDFPVFLHPDTGEEYALARTERKSGHGYHGFDLNAAPTVTLEEDLRRRDLTINAMAMDASDTLIDPWGGKADLNARRLRHVSPAFGEDPLRVLRVARFAARYHMLGFTIAPGTRQLMQDVVISGELEHLPMERVWVETERALGGSSPAVYFQVLDSCGAMARLMPEINAAALQALNTAADGVATSIERWAALMSPLRQPAIEQIAASLKIPNAFRDFSRSVAYWLNELDERDPAAVLTTLTRAKALKKTEAFEQLIATLAALRGECAVSGNSASFLRAAKAALDDVDTAALRAQGYEGEALGQAIEQVRLRNLRAVVDRRETQYT